MQSIHGATCMKCPFFELVIILMLSCNMSYGPSTLMCINEYRFHTLNLMYGWYCIFSTTVISVVLTLVMGQRYLDTGKLMPAGIVAGIRLVLALGIAITWRIIQLEYRLSMWKPKTYNHIWHIIRNSRGLILGKNRNLVLSSWAFIKSHIIPLCSMVFLVNNQQVSGICVFSLILWEHGLVLELYLQIRVREFWVCALW